MNICCINEWVNKWYQTLTSLVSTTMEKCRRTGENTEGLEKFSTLQGENVQGPGWPCGLLGDTPSLLKDACPERCLKVQVPATWIAFSGFWFWFLSRNLTPGDHLLLYPQSHLCSPVNNYVLIYNFLFWSKWPEGKAVSVTFYSSFTEQEYFSKAFCWNYLM